MAAFFVLAAVNKIMNFDATTIGMAEVGLEPAAVLLPMVIALEGLGGLSIALAHRRAWISAAVLAVFTLATNAFFHRFWELDGLMGQLELSLFFKNVAIAGGLVYISAHLYRHSNRLEN
ncbi:DoxX family protein [Erythrobacter sp. KMU-140]|uniref:DoxX family protein n=1 Tax=Erythrobacter rubeus TaxID=2760803 RepID=A0ABR8KKU3_9SPHN|nr:DoxX family protein [Erythrobacter rubeus]